jgi:hypothetical protein
MQSDTASLASAVAGVDRSADALTLTGENDRHDSEADDEGLYH